MGSKNKVIDFREIQHEKMSRELGFNFHSDVWEIKTNEEAAQKKIRFKIKEEELESVYYCLDNTIESLSDWIDEEGDEDRRRELKEQVAFYNHINSILETKLDEETGTFLNISYSDFENLLVALEGKIDPYIDIRTRELNFDDISDELFIEYLVSLKKVYDRINEKYRKFGIEEELYPGVKEFRRYGQILFENEEIKINNKIKENNTEELE